MPAAARHPSVASGIALLGASMIAAAPATMHQAPDTLMPPIHLTSVVDDVLDIGALGALDPISPWINIVGEAFNNVGGLGQMFLESPAPILTQVLTNQLGYAQDLGAALEGAGNGLVTLITEQLPDGLQTAFTQLAAGEFFDGVNTLYGTALFGPVIALGLPLLSGLIPPIQAMAGNINALAQGGLLAVLGPALGLLAPVNASVAAFADTGQTILDAVSGGNVPDALGQIINLPATLAGAFLNGYDTAGFWSGLVPETGLLTNPISSGGDVLSGTFAAIFDARDTLANLLGGAGTAGGLFSGIQEIVNDVVGGIPAALGLDGLGIDSGLQGLFGGLTGLDPAALFDGLAGIPGMLAALPEMIMAMFMG